MIRLELALHIWIDHLLLVLSDCNDIHIFIKFFDLENNKSRDGYLPRKKNFQECHCINSHSISSKYFAIHIE